jgi:hypothetical protein
LAVPVLGQARTEQLAKTCWRFLELDDVRGLLDLALPA